MCSSNLLEGKKAKKWGGIVNHGLNKTGKFEVDIRLERRGGGKRKWG